MYFMHDLPSGSVAVVILVHIVNMDNKIGCQGRTRCRNFGCTECPHI